MGASRTKCDVAEVASGWDSLLDLCGANGVLAREPAQQYGTHRRDAELFLLL